MQIKIFLSWRIALLCILLFTSSSLSSSPTPQLLDGSGSGDEPTDVIPVVQDGDDDGSGSGQEPIISETFVIPIKPSNPDDEDDDGIMFSSGSGDGDYLYTRPNFNSYLDRPNVKCSKSSLYCWCLDTNDNEIVGTRKFVEDIVEPFCEDWPIVKVVSNPVTVKASPPTIRAHTPTYAPRRTTTKKFSRRPFSFIKEATTSYGKAGEAEGREGDDIYRERVTPLFTHPGILAAIIGGGIVALLCALLLVMFIVYRMRKKDEGSYPLDPDAKPPRLHTYTRAPNKEFYA